eukprot:gnl/TRDRNA2_/TRDRNA2_90027_c0_seq1.p1 gnl/TRDRNA2_/TRDRNA2_90027_c0~~gnl/TRDRNA2_/TRDRNA2_90027_c0_seq1.p1  ORF type:complete len:210 (+),score=23.31 gnl/TRDRNA2_/TRDRNA2_90027_c0_seq1:127-756(+)
MINVTRHPYSFVGDSSRGFFDDRTIELGLDTWDNALKRDKYPKQAVVQPGKQAGLPAFDFEVRINRAQPIDSQRVLLWAGRFGKQELFMTAINRRHFHERKSAHSRETVLESAQEAGLDIGACRAFLETDELHQEVLRSYHVTIFEKGIHSIPLFVFNTPFTDGGPFRSGCGKAEVVNGSSSVEEFGAVFERLFAATVQAQQQVVRSKP